MKWKFYSRTDTNNSIELPEEQTLKEIKERVLDSLDNDLYMESFNYYFEENRLYPYDLYIASSKEKKKYLKEIKKETEICALEGYFIDYLDIIKIYDNNGKNIYDFTYKDCRTKWGKQLIKDAFKVK